MESNFCDLSPILLISTTNTFFFLSTLSFFFLSTLPCIFKQYSSHLPNNLSYTIYSQQQQNKTKLQNKTRFKIIEVRCNKYIIYMHRYIDTCFTDKKKYINTDLGTSLWWYTLKELRSSISPIIMLGKQKGML